MKYAAGDVRKSEGAAVVDVGEFFMVHPKEMQHRCMDVVDVYWVGHHFVSDLIGLSIRGATLYPAARHPEATSVWVMVATGRFAVEELGNR